MWHVVRLLERQFCVSLRDKFRTERELGRLEVVLQKFLVVATRESRASDFCSSRIANEAQAARAFSELASKEEGNDDERKEFRYPLL